MKKNSKEKQTGLFNKLKSFYQSRYGKMTLFFGFYFFFFLFLILNFNFNSINQNGNNNENTNQNDSNNTQNNNDYNNNYNTTWEFNTLINDNYNYTYYIKEDDNFLIFSGRINEDNSLIKEYSNNYFLNLYNINQIIKNSKYLERIKIENGYQYNYEITNKSLGDLLNNEILSNELNTITIYTNNEFVIEKIELDLNSYMKNINKFNKYEITLQYEKVEE